MCKIFHMEEFVVKKLGISLTTLLMALSLVGCSSTTTEETTTEETSEEEVTMVDGDYTATVNGFYGDFEVTVTITDGAISSVVAGENSETVTLGGVAIEKISAAVVEKQTYNVDSVSGATVTSAAYKMGIRDALESAGAPDSMFEAAVYEQEDFTYDTDVLVVGAGAAGYAAAVTAAQAGANVILIEKQDVVGGSSITSAGIVYSALDEADITVMEEYYMERANGNADEEIVNYFAENSMDTIEWLTENGVEWMFTSPSGTASEARAYFAMNVTGESLITPLEEAAEAAGVTTITDCAAYELITDESGAVVGALASGKHATYTFNAKAVILTCGGYDASEEMKEQYSPIAVGDFALSSKGNTGDGINMGIAVGADTVFKGGIIGFVFVDGTLPNSGYSGAVLTAPLFVSSNGDFVTEGIDYPITYTAMKESGYEDFYAIWDADGADSAQVAVDAGYGYTADTLEELAELSGMDLETLQAAVAQVEGVDTAPYYAIVAQPTTIGSMGGLKINTNAEVLDTDGNAIAGLYAAGETANGDFYDVEYPASGTSNAMSFTYGRTAAKSAVAYIAE